ncbi:class II fumarate hydratase [Thermodesulfobium sp. 4217-1]|uniref:class II fumarate hydratase n=1 Tax=Thermodesulfobium sp. 4217-1 TaxID=3120013 RepID=UPI00322209D7
MNFRVEEDVIGQVRIPEEKLWGIQTQRAIENFKVGNEVMPFEIIKSLGIVKKAAAKANLKLKILEEKKSKAIVEAVNEIIDGKFLDQFPLHIWQTGSGTSTNMNINEVIANRANQILKENIVDPHDDVNMCQSTNDIFPTAMHIAFVSEIKKFLFPALDKFSETLKDKSSQYKNIIKVGRTHLQDAVPITLGQEISAWQTMIDRSKSMIESSLDQLKDLALGGSAVGTGLNVHHGFEDIAVREINKITGENFSPSANKFYSLSSREQIVFSHGALKSLATDLMKIANDIRLLSSGPRCGIGEISIPANEPGSSIMPGKVNPTQCEVITMVVCQIFGNDLTISFASSQGNFQLNVFAPVIAYNFLQSVKLLSDSISSFDNKCVKGLTPNIEKINYYLKNSLMSATFLNPYIGYDKTANVVKEAFTENISIKEAVLKLGYLEESEYDLLFDLRKMVGLE